MGARVEPTPAAIDWGALCEAAIWRRPPFQGDPKNPDSEKGFRDALILETLVSVAKQQPGDVKIVFLCNDELLRATAEARLGDDKRCSFHESVSDFSSYVKLTNEKHSAEFIKALVDRATKKFYDRGVDSSLWFREKISERITGEHQGRLKPPDDGTSGGTGSDWQGLRAHWLIRRAEFISAKEKTFHWKTQVRSLQGLRRVTAPTSAPGGIEALLEAINKLLPHERVLVASFNVFWKAYVKNDGRFHDLAVERIEFESQSFNPPTPEERTRFGFEPETAKEPPVS